MENIIPAIISGVVSIGTCVITYKGLKNEFDNKIKLIKEESVEEIKKMERQYELKIKEYEENKKIDITEKTFNIAMNNKNIQKIIEKMMLDSFKINS